MNTTFKQRFAKDLLPVLVPGKRVRSKSQEETKKKKQPRKTNSVEFNASDN